MALISEVLQHRASGAEIWGRSLHGGGGEVMLMRWTRRLWCLSWGKMEIEKSSSLSRWVIIMSALAKQTKLLWNPKCNICDVMNNKHTPAEQSTAESSALFRQQLLTQFLICVPTNDKPPHPTCDSLYSKPICHFNGKYMPVICSVLMFSKPWCLWNASKLIEASSSDRLWGTWPSPGRHTSKRIHL